MPIETVHDVVAEARASFTLGTRADGSEFWHTTDDAPEWVREMVHAAHGTMLPDDYCYLFTVQALDALAECLGDTGSAEDVEAYMPQIIAYSDVAEWLGSHAYRFEYADEAWREFGRTSGSTFDRLATGMAYERSEVLASVMRSVEARAASLGIEG